MRAVQHSPFPSARYPEHNTQRHGDHERHAAKGREPNLDAGGDRAQGDADSHRQHQPDHGDAQHGDPVEPHGHGEDCACQRAGHHVGVPRREDVRGVEAGAADEGGGQVGLERAVREEDFAGEV